MAANKIRITLDFTEEQLETTKTFFNFNDCDFEESKVSETKKSSAGNCEVSTQTENTEPGPQTPCESQDDRTPPASIRICQKRNVLIVFVCHA